MRKVGLRKEVGGVGNRIHTVQKKKGVKGHKRSGGDEGEKQRRKTKQSLF